jgi:hypothetical protein
MSDRITLDELLTADPRDCGCEAGLLVLDELIELECTGADPAERFPAQVAHLRGCPACRFDHDSLLELVRAGG